MSIEVGDIIEILKDENGAPVGSRCVVLNTGSTLGISYMSHRGVAFFCGSEDRGFCKLIHKYHQDFIEERIRHHAQALLEYIGVEDLLRHTAAINAYANIIEEKYYE